MNNAWYRKLSFFTRSTAAAVIAITDEGEAQNARGLTHWTGNNEPKSLVLALECFRKAADLGHAGAQGNLATMLAGGQGTQRDGDQAQAWFLRAAKQGDAAAQFNLAVRFHRANMRGLTADASQGRIQALTWFLLSAAQDYQKANEWCERLRVDMTREEVVESTRRASEFIPCKESVASAKDNVTVI